MDEYETFLKEIIVKAGVITKKYFGKVGVHKTKTGINDVVTIADLKTQKFIVKAIQKKFPTHGIIGEEDANIRTDAEYVWIIDPIDGTRNYSKAIPIYGVMIALARNDDVILSGIYMPMTKELYIAKKGQGAFLNGKQIHCSNYSDFVDSNGTTNAALNNRKMERYAKLTKNLGDRSINLIALGSIAVTSSLVADGRKDWTLSVGGGKWDYASTALLLRESGCKVTTIEGTEWTINDKQIVAANPILHEKIIKLLNP